MLRDLTFGDLLPVLALLALCAPVCFVVITVLAGTIALLRKNKR